MTALPQPINLFEFEQFAKERLPKEEYDYIAGGATDEISVDRNRRALCLLGAAPARAARRERVGSVDQRARHENQLAGFDRALRRDTSAPIPKASLPPIAPQRRAARISRSAPIRILSFEELAKAGARTLSGSRCIRFATKK